MTGLVRHASYARVAGTLCQVGEGGAVLAHVIFTEPGDWEQTAAAGEHLAAWLAERLSELGATVVAD